MKRKTALCILIFLIFNSFTYAISQQYRPDYIFVRFFQANGESISLSQKINIINQFVPGCTVKKSYRVVPDLLLVKLPSYLTVPVAIEKFMEIPLIMYAEPVYKRHVEIEPNDEFFPEQWALVNTGQMGGLVDADIDANEAWDTFTGTRDIIVAVVDTGVDHNHPDLIDNMWVNVFEAVGFPGVDDDGNGYVDDIYGWDVVGAYIGNPVPDGDPCDSMFHGTHVAGIIGAVADNGMGVAGVNWQVSIMAVKIFDDNAPSFGTYDDLEIAGIEYALINGAKVINASWGGYGYSQALYDIIAEARDTYGALFIAAAGNESNNNDGGFPSYPSSYDLDNIISVAATDNRDLLAYFSNYGLTSVDLGAPGDMILSTFPSYETNDITLYNFATDYEVIGGTSMAAPHVAGAAGLIWGYKPLVDYQKVRDSILFSADQLDSLSGQCVTGARLNLKGAIDAISAQVLNRNTDIIYDSIQEAIDDPQTLDGHTLIAEKDATFFEAVDFKGKKVYLRSGNITNPDDPNIWPETTIINARGRNRHAVTFQTGEDENTVISGFTITEGYATGLTIFDKFGGGIFCQGASPSIDNCIIKGNRAQFDGGGIYCDDNSNPVISTCMIMDNIASGRDGGGIYCYDSSPWIFNCLIVNNKALRDGGAIYFNGISLAFGQPRVTNCTISGNNPNPYDGLGGGIYCYWRVEPEIKNTIFTENSGYAIYEEDLLSDPLLTNCLFYNNPDGDYYDADTTTVYTGAAQINNIGDASGTIDGDPLFAHGRLGDYYLSQIAAGQLADSNAVDAGSGYAVDIGLNFLSTRTDNVPDEGTVDMGFHFYDPCKAVTYTLNTFVVPAGRASLQPAPGTPHIYPQFAHVQLVAQATDTRYQFKAWRGTDDDTKREVNPANGVPLSVQHNIVTMDSDKNVIAEFETRLVTLVVTVTTGNGTVQKSPPPEDPRRDLYARGTVVTLTAIPANPSHRVQWTGTDDDTSGSLVNTVTMTADKQVMVEFYAPRTLIVGGGGVPGAYTELQPALNNARNGDIIVIHPGEWGVTWPMGGWLVENKAITIKSTNPDDPCVVARTVLTWPIAFENVRQDTVLAGVTFRNFSLFMGGNGANGNTDSDGNGYDGGSAYGGALRLGLMNIYALQYPDFYAASEASPTIVNCRIENISLTAGNGGNATGCPSLACGGWGGGAHGGGIYVGIGCNPIIKNCIIRDCTALGGDGGNGCFLAGSWGDENSIYWLFGPYDPYWKYSGMGGGVYCDVNSAPEFIDCTFQNNSTSSGSSGLSEDYGWPHWRIDSYGGAAYISANSSARFVGCSFISNEVEPNALIPLWRGTGEVQLADKYIGYGGAVAIEGTIDSYDVFPGTPTIPITLPGAKPVFENCTFTNNQSPNGNGGAIQAMSAGFSVLDTCTFTNNTALHGGAMYFVNGDNYIINSIFSNNAATDDVGEGGAIFAFDANAMIVDSNIVSNTAVSSGGGVFISGSSNITLKNCLITDNNSQRDGGGVSVNVHADVNLINCTITGNLGGRYGGGLYCSYNSFTKVLDSIIWGNFAADGHQIAIASGDPYYPQPSVVEVSYSSVGPRYALSAFGIEPNLTGAGSGGASAQLIDAGTIYNDVYGTGWANVIISLDEPFELRKNIDWDSPADLDALHAEIDLRQNAVLSTLTSGEFVISHRCDNITAFSGQINNSGLQKLLDNPMVNYIEPVRIVYPAMRQGLNLTNGMGIRPKYSGLGVAVAIVDTGVDYRHPKLGGGAFPNAKVIGGYDTGEMDADPIPVGVAHGTCCAGIAAGMVANVGDYIGGVAYNAKIYALKAAPDNAGYFFNDAILAAWDWCITHKNDSPDYPLLVISNSFGGGQYTTEAQADADYPASATMIATAVDAGITVLASSGNNGFIDSLSYPAALSNVISVGAVYDLSDMVIGYSNTAPILDILAPSDPTYTTDIIGAAGYAAGDYYPYFDGTSSSCPFAAGLAAVVQSAAKQAFGAYLAPEQVRMLLVASGRSVTDTKVAITKPRVDIGAAISALTSGPIYIEKGSRIEHNWWDPLNFTWDLASHNLDVNDNPLFVEGFYLSQIESDQAVDSNDVDAGDRDAFTADFYRHTTRTDLEIEDYDSIIDLGWHYIRTTEFVGDLNYDGMVDWADFDRFMRHWLSDCGFPDYCHGADFNKDGVVNYYDYAILAANFGKKETTPPEPNPMTWDIFPMSQEGVASVTMKATKAKDNYGGRIGYYFEQLRADGVPDGNSSGWRTGDPNRTWETNSLTTKIKVNQTVGYRVKARDKRGNETEWSVIGYVVVGKESVPQPPINLEAQAISQNQINLTWTDTSINETGFRIERRTGIGQFAQVAAVAANVVNYSDTGLACGTTYIYRVCAFNGAGNSAYSNEASATTGACPIEPNKPTMIYGNVDPNSREYYQNGYWYHLVVAQVPDLGGPIPVWFRFVCLDSPVLSSQWVNAAGAFPHPVNPALPNVQITVNGNIVTYTIVVKVGGSFGWGLNWQVCASYNADGTGAVCSDPLRIPPPWVPP